MDNITLQNECLRVTITPMGAEILSVQNADGIEFIWQGDDTHWSRHAPILFPVAGGFKDGIYKLDGQTFSMQQHGFAREKEFAVEAQTAEACTFLLEGAAAAHPSYPFNYALRARYTLSGNKLTAETIVTNAGDIPLYYAAGSHEAYACPEGCTQYSLQFDQPEMPLERAVFAGRTLSGERADVPIDGNTLPVTESLFVQDTLVMPWLHSRGVALVGPNRRVHVEYTDFPYLLVWTQWGAKYLCIEPWHNLPDMADTDHDFAKKPGVIRVETDCQSKLSHTMTFETR